MTALALAAAQCALLCSGVAMAQTTDTSADGQSGEATTVVVTGQRQALQTAAKIKQNAEEIVDSVVADEAGKLPDKSITEVLQRVVGVTMDRNRSRVGGGILGGQTTGFNVEGSGVQIRGLSWGSSTLNGRESFSAGWPGRELSWGDVPPELMSGVDVYKNPSSDLIEGGISGQINLRTRLPFDQKAQFGSFSASSNYTVLGKKTAPAVSGLYSNRWKTSFGEFGALIDVSANRNSYRSDSLNQGPYLPRTDIEDGKTLWVPSGGTYWSTSEGTSTRRGLYGALQWRNDRIETALTYFDSKFTEVGTGNGTFSGGDAPWGMQYTNAKYDQRGVFQSGTLTYPTSLGLDQFPEGGILAGTSTSYTHVMGRTRELAWNTKFRLNESWGFQNDLQWVHANNNSDGELVNLQTFVPSMYLDLSGSRPIVGFDDKARAFLADYKNYTWNAFQPALAAAKADLYAWKGDAKYTFDHPVLRDVRFGARVTYRKSTHENSTGSGWHSLAEPWAVSQATTYGDRTPQNVGWQRSNFAYMSDPHYQVPGGTQVYSFPNFFNGALQAPPTIVVPSMSLVRGYPNAYVKYLLPINKQMCVDEAIYKGNTPNCDSVNADWRPESLTADPSAKDSLNRAGATSTHAERTEALYSTLRFGFDNWKYPVEGSLGARLVRTKTMANGYMIFDPKYDDKSDPSLPRFAYTKVPLSLGGSHIDLIPTLNLKVNWTDKLQSRMAVSRNMYRPGFDQMQEYITLSQNVTTDQKTNLPTRVDYTGTNSGNAKLRPLKSNNLDFTLEWYPRDGQSLTFGTFAKKVTDIIMTQTYTRTINDIAGNPQEFTISGPANAAQLWAIGAEIAGMTYLDKLPFLDKVLPDWAKGFGISSNFSYIKGRQTMYHPFNEPYCARGNLSMASNLSGCDTNGLPFKGDMPLPYSSPRAFNLGLMYDRGSLSMRLAYSWRDRYMMATGNDGATGWWAPSADPAQIAANGGKVPHDVSFGLPIWMEAAGQWDAGLNYKVSDHMYTSFNVSNLSNVVFRQTQQQSIGFVGRSWNAPGRSFRASMGYTF
jgi:TonB-dependent receptor